MGSSKRFVQSVLLVDDAEMMLRAWSRECRRFGKIPFTASTRTEAVQVAARERPEMAVVDLLMPNESGLQIVRELKSLSIDIFVILKLPRFRGHPKTGVSDAEKATTAAAVYA